MTLQREIVGKQRSKRSSGRVGSLNVPIYQKLEKPTGLISNMQREIETEECLSANVQLMEMISEHIHLNKHREKDWKSLLLLVQATGYSLAEWASVTSYNYEPLTVERLLQRYGADKRNAYWFYLGEAIEKLIYVSSLDSASDLEEYLRADREYWRSHGKLMVAAHESKCSLNDIKTLDDVNLEASVERLEHIALIKSVIVKKIDNIQDYLKPNKAYYMTRIRDTLIASGELQFLSPTNIYQKLKIINKEVGGDWTKLYEE
ncbi:hypothetical protein BCV08_11715 [Vibrio breoganii]|uniref:hypothetical protein n=1 Tax=Vibrio breoganii TaxID=553239 RepID=UPI000365F8D0|nr:hypothetical protein [Vibrio breoganii]OEF86031.1 hypothetical protein B003_16110 [Vibrio breoganii 1C10]PMF92631.1 hypothetical protein BCV08_11715 [Vibrio breoganii]